MKERLDVILVEQGYAPSREKAKAIIMSMSTDRRKTRPAPDLMSARSNWKSEIIP